MSKLGRPVGSAVYGLRILNHHVAQQLTDALEPHDLTLPQMGLLADVRRIPGVSSAALARVRSLTPQTMSEIITGLEKQRLIERRPHGGRILRLYLTPAGTTRLSSALAAAADVERRMLAGLSPKEQERFRDLIFQCVAHLTADQEQRAG
ncbi:MAG TPA: MarR family transcriptional regulator [Candidatus Limnocylindria bacterium]|nr:MarR family transcriptional regulator [Candidatus Limnocylindria bacterium]